MREISLKTERKTQLVDITEQVQDALGDTNGAAAALVYVPHTTAGVTINEHADPLVADDLENALQRVVDDDWDWKHVEDRTARTRRRTCARRSTSPQVLIPLARRRARARHLAGHLLLRVRRSARPQGLRHHA